METPPPSRREQEIMEKRLRRILDPATPRRPPGTAFRLAALGTTLAAAVMLACTSGDPTTPDSVDPQPAAAEVAPAAGDVIEAGAPKEGPIWLAGASVEPQRPPAIVQEGFLDVASVVKEMERHVGDLEQCYERSRRIRPELSGMVVMRWTITTKGVVPEHSVKQDFLQDDEVLFCLERAIEEARFPESRGGTVEVSFPFFFGRPPSEADGC